MPKHVFEDVGFAAQMRLGRSLGLQSAAGAEGPVIDAEDAPAAGEKLIDVRRLLKRLSAMEKLVFAEGVIAARRGRIVSRLLVPCHPSAVGPLEDRDEREYLVRILRITGGSVTRAAKLAQRNRTEFYKLLERHKLEPKMFKPEKG